VITAFWQVVTFPHPAREYTRSSNVGAGINTLSTLSTPLPCLEQQTQIHADSGHAALLWYSKETRSVCFPHLHSLKFELMAPPICYAQCPVTASFGNRC
jgi:hypothetical protein